MLFHLCVQVDDDVILNFQQKIFDIHDKHVHLEIDISITEKK